MNTEEIIVSPVEDGARIDLLLAKRFTQYSRSYFQKLITDTDVIVNDKIVKPSHLVKAGDKIDITLREIQSELEPQAENIPLDIIYEDVEVIVINKQPGIVVHPAAGNTSGTLVNALVGHFPAIKESVIDKTSTISKQRPGLVHRLDKDTSGVIIIAKTPRAMHSLARQIQNRTIQKIYWALCFGWPKNENGTIASYLGRHPKNRKVMADVGPEKGKEAVSNFRVIKYMEDASGNRASLLEFDIKTGRTHQIRVHAKQIGNPVLGDPTYGSKTSIYLSHKLGITRQMLHAKSLSVCLPGNSQKTTFEAKIPLDFEKAASKLKIINS
ncbi:MAG: RluA family pseudouridine synthase [Patescibacteria group bacterium]|jgi:23S rRNA pseudouridine1911/1915/1917 synthase